MQTKTVTRELLCDLDAGEMYGVVYHSRGVFPEVQGDVGHVLEVFSLLPNSEIYPLALVSQSKGETKMKLNTEQAYKELNALYDRADTNNN